MSLNKSTFWIVIASLATPLLTNAESLPSTFQSALELSPQQRQALIAVESSAAASEQTKALQSGSVVANFGLGLNNFNGYSPLLPKELYKQKNAGVSYSIPLYTSGRLENLLAASRIGERVAQDNRKNTEQQVLLNAGAAYLAVSRTKDLERLARNQQEILARELDQAEKELKAGIRTKTDVSQAQARLSGARARVEQASANIKEALANYKAIVGRLPEGTLSAADLSFDISKNRYVSQVLTTNPLVSAAHSKISQAEANFEAVKAEDGATIQLTANVTTDRQSNPMLLKESSQSIGVQLSIPLYEGGKSQARKSTATLVIQSAQADYDSLALELEAQATIAWETYASLQAQEVALGEQWEAAQMSLVGVRTEYKVGTRTLLDVLNAEQELLEAKTALLTLGYQKNEAILRLKALAGQLSA